MIEQKIFKAEAPDSAATQRQRILVVDDERMIRQLNTEVLSCSGYQVDAAEDGAVAWDALQLNNYDLLITDHDMPKVTGVELLKKLHAARMALPVIMATGTPPEEELDRHPWLQIQAVLLKPYTFDELLGTVKNVLHAATGGPGQLASPGQIQPPAPRLQT
jgi:DNA-binding response OmpR family regulator